MYALRNTQYGKSYIRDIDGLFTSNKQSAKLFNTIQEAEDYYYIWLNTTGVDKPNELKLAIVEVETKPVITRYVGEVKLLWD